jgi:ubiquinone/menaquinone biosynthesis C-methylase UbiE
MAKHIVCPWWLGYLLASPLRSWISEPPESLLAPYVRAGMTVLEPGPGMGFFTLPLACMVGPAGRVVAIDIQPKMLASLQRRAKKAGLHERIETRLAEPESLGVGDINGSVDFALAFAVVHELPSVETFFREAAAALKPGGLLFLAEPSGHVNQEGFQMEIDAARQAGLFVVDRPTVRRSLAVVLCKA